MFSLLSSLWVLSACYVTCTSLCLDLGGWNSLHALPESVFDLSADHSIVKGDFVEVAKSQRRLPSLSARV